jgi:hypothetical protein
VTLSKRLFSSAQFNGFLTDILMSMSVHQYCKTNFTFGFHQCCHLQKLNFSNFYLSNIIPISIKAWNFDLIITLLSHNAKNIKIKADFSGTMKDNLKISIGLNSWCSMRSLTYIWLILKKYKICIKKQKILKIICWYSSLK